MRRRTLAVIGGAAALLLVSATAAYATHRFSDVQDDHRFADEIGAIADACITSGYDDGTFRPGANLSRQAEAAFISRAGGMIVEGNQGPYIRFGAGTPVDETPRKRLATVSVSVPEGLAGCTQQVHLTGTANLMTWSPGNDHCFGSATHCNAYLSIVDDTGEVIGTGLLRLTDDATGASISTQAVVTVGEGDHEFGLEVWSNAVAEDAAMATRGQLVAQRAPFGG